jgi:uncharacterized membrane protein
VTLEVWGMSCVGFAVLVAGLVVARARFRPAAGADKILVLGPVFEAVPLAMFAMEHFLAAHALAQIVPKWLPGPLFWTYFVGAALLAAAISFIAWRCIRWSAALLALLFLIIVATVDLPNLSVSLHDRLFWTLTVRELCFGSGALALAGSTWPYGGVLGTTLMRVGRWIVGAVMVFYGIEHFFFPRNVPGVPLEKLTPPWVPAPTLLAYSVGITLVLAGIGLFVHRTVRVAATTSGIVLLALTAFFYVPIFALEIHSELAVEGINYVGDTLLFAATVLLAGSSAEAAADSTGGAPVPL